jgi:hypothetical protein
MAAVAVTLGGITFGSDTPDLNSAVWSVEEIEGWDSPDLREELLDLPGQDRQAIGPLYYKARALVLRGACRTPTDASFWASRTRLQTATLLTTAAGTLTVAETTTKKLEVYRAGRLRMRPYKNLRGFVFEVPLTAPDPRILANSPTSITPGGTATNNGNFKASPTLTVTGSAAGPVVIAKTTGTTGSVSITTSVPGGQQLVVDFKARSVLLNGVNRYDLITSTPTWFEIEPGANTITYSGGGTPSLSWSDSWI